jgi:hypothetical protein
VLPFEAYQPGKVRLFVQWQLIVPSKSKLSEKAPELIGIWLTAAKGNIASSEVKAL